MPVVVGNGPWCEDWPYKWDLCDADAQAQCNSLALATRSNVVFRENLMWRHDCDFDYRLQMKLQRCMVTWRSVKEFVLLLFPYTLFHPALQSWWDGYGS